MLHKGFPWREETDPASAPSSTGSDWLGALLAAHHGQGMESCPQSSPPEMPPRLFRALVLKSPQARGLSGQDRRFPGGAGNPAGMPTTVLQILGRPPG